MRREMLQQYFFVYLIVVPAAAAAVCEDSVTWFQNANPSRDCGWVAAAPGSRYSARDAGGATAETACLVTCATCIDPPRRRCGDSKKRRRSVLPPGHLTPIRSAYLSTTSV